MSRQGKLPWCEFTTVVGVRISLWYEILQRYHVNANWPHVLGWNQSADRPDRLEWVAHAQCLRFWITYVFHQVEMYLQISRYEMTLRGGGGGTPIHYLYPFQRRFLERGMKNCGSPLYLLLKIVVDYEEAFIWCISRTNKEIFNLQTF